jgi:hypothetical protein
MNLWETFRHARCEANKTPATNANKQRPFTTRRRERLGIIILGRFVVATQPFVSNSPQGRQSWQLDTQAVVIPGRKSRFP